MRHNIRKQNQLIIPVFNALSVSMKFKFPVMVFFGSAQKKRENHIGMAYSYAGHLHIQTLYICLISAYA
ncbi:TPA: hypothetical protein I4D46_17565 [Enterobacter hormaechei]|nr:hypothetical protein [Enterobacter hormaechei]